MRPKADRPCADNHERRPQNVSAVSSHPCYSQNNRHPACGGSRDSKYPFECGVMPLHCGVRFARLGFGPGSSFPCLAFFSSARIAFGVNSQGSQLAVCRMTTNRRGPCAPCTRIFSISAVRLEPLMTHANELRSSIPSREARPSAAAKSGTNCAVEA